MYCQNDSQGTEINNSLGDNNCNADERCLAVDINESETEILSNDNRSRNNYINCVSLNVSGFTE